MPPTWEPNMPRDPIDLHEIQKKELYSQGAQPSMPVIDAQPGETQQPVYQPPPPSGGNNIGLDDTYIHFDSLAKNSSSNLSSGEIDWSISVLNRGLPINNCTQITISPFYFPLIENAPGAPEFYFYRQVYMRLVSVPSTQGVMVVNNDQYHFTFDIESVSSIAVKLRPAQPTFFFRQPINSLSQFEVQFFVPSTAGAGLRAIPIHTDTMIIVAVPGSNPARFDIINGDISPLVDLATLPSTFPTAPYVPPTPIAIVIRGFQTANANLNMAVGNLQGVYVDQLESMTSFSISSLDFTTLATPTDATAVIGKNRIQIMARFSSINASTANYVQPHHS